MGVVRRLAYQLDRLFVTAAVPDLGAELDAGPLGVDQQIGMLFIVDRIADRWGVLTEDQTEVWFEIDVDAMSHGGERAR